jgi:hypothetical protein
MLNDLEEKSYVVYVEATFRIPVTVSAQSEMAAKEKAARFIANEIDAGGNDLSWEFEYMDQPDDFATELAEAPEAGDIAV